MIQSSPGQRGSVVRLHAALDRLAQATSRRGAFALLYIVFAPCISLFSTAQTGVRYKVLDRGPSLVRTLINTPGLNNGGTLAIWNSANGASITGVVFEGDKSTPILGADRFSFVYPADVNDDGVVVGSVQAPQDLRFTQAFKWSQGNLKLLGHLDGPYAVATAINSSGAAVGSALTAIKTRHAVIWEKDAPRDLGLMGTGDYSSARDISNSGEVVGEGNITPNGKPHAFLWHAGQMQQLPDYPGGSFCSAQAVSDKRWIVGSCDLPEGEAHGVLWRNGEVVDLGTLGDDDSPSTALDINSKGEVVGSSEIADAKLRAFLWKDGKMTDLNKLIAPKSGWLLLVASRINDHGEIAGRGFYQGVIHAFLLQPVLGTPIAASRQ